MSSGNEVVVVARPKKVVRGKVNKSYKSAYLLVFSPILLNVTGILGVPYIFPQIYTANHATLLLTDIRNFSIGLQ